tara:strand:- start:7056 stop:7844 length:789 start_codon:yes stop_codon:yes gene_type:complete
MDLKNIQKNFMAALQTNEMSTLIEPLIEVDHNLDAKQRINIYRQSILGNVISILKDAYPVCFKLVGEQYFTALCQRFIMSHQNHHPDMSQYGSLFAAFLATFEPVQQQLPYLPDMARLEWACCQALDSAEYQPINLFALEQVPESQQTNLIFQLPVGSTLFDSCYPILSIWQQNQADSLGEENVNLDFPGDKLIIFRQDWTLLIHPLSEMSHNMLEMIAEGKSFGEVSEKLLQKYKKINIPETFRECVKNGWLVGFQVAACD